MHANGLVALGAVVALSASLAAVAYAERELPLPPPPAPPEVEPLTGPSNVHARDYVGPQVCGECHEERHAQWSNNLHRAMNRLIDEPGAVLGDFDDARLEYATGSVIFDRFEGAPRMTFLENGEVVRRFRITRTIGSRHIQEYVGIQTEGPEAPDHMLFNTETRLPFGYWFRKQRWFHQQYFDNWHGEEYGPGGAVTRDPYAPDANPWDGRCAWCHNTYPYEIRHGRPGRTPGLDQLTNLEPHGNPTWARRVKLHNRLPTDALVTVGISCESCHFGGREHAENEAPISFVPVSPVLTWASDGPELEGGRENNRVVNLICGQCHTSPGPRYPGGASQRNSNEARDLATSPCVEQAKCTSCHDPHVKGKGGMAPDDPGHLAACTGCHEALAGEEEARAHARHDPGQASCLDCHMPRIVQGFSHVVRTHQIGNPARPEMLEAGAPNACNLCHLERSVAWTLEQLQVGWGAERSLDREPSREPQGEVWLRGTDPLVRVTAAAAYGRSPLGPGAVSTILERLDDPVAYYRMRMLFALEDILGRPLAAAEYDPMAAPESRAAAVRTLVQRHEAGELVPSRPDPEGRVHAPRG